MDFGDFVRILLRHSFNIDLSEALNLYNDLYPAPEPEPEPMPEREWALLVPRYDYWRDDEPPF